MGASPEKLKTELEVFAFVVLTQRVDLAQMSHPRERARKQIFVAKIPFTAGFRRKAYFGIVVLTPGTVGPNEG